MNGRLTHQAERNGQREPIRMCVACGKRREISTLFRIVRNPSGDPTLDTRRRMSGRGAHVCRTGTCFETAIDRSLFNRAFRAKVNCEVLRVTAVNVKSDAASSKARIL